MPIVDVVLLPSHLSPGRLDGRCVVVLDVLRATTSITAALAAGVTEVRSFTDTLLARAAAEKTHPRPILSGEVRALPPPGFDLGNSPRQFTREHAGRTVYVATTNGTRVLAAARSAGTLFVGALVNASAVAAAVAGDGRDVVLLCAGTEGSVSLEDVIGAGAIADTLIRRGFSPASDAALLARQSFLAARSDLPGLLRQTQGGRNVIAAGLEPDIDYAARLDALKVVGQVDPATLTIRAF